MLAIVIRTFVIQVFYIPSASMQPTLLIQDRIVVNKFIYRFKPTERFDIIVFKFPGEPARDFIKRVVGLPGETVALKKGKLYINHVWIEETHPLKIDQDDFGPVTVPPDHYFVMGDNRANSSDSRFWGFLPKHLILGKAFLRIWPLPRFGPLSLAPAVLGRDHAPPVANLSV